MRIFRESALLLLTLTTTASAQWYHFCICMSEHDGRGDIEGAGVPMDDQTIAVCHGLYGPNAFSEFLKYCVQPSDQDPMWPGTFRSECQLVGAKSSHCTNDVTQT
ncbi:hypothetical protein Tdes44962_MAKER09668 [Teratosphaeria destructans]|uniref:Uncharacterized protein n=1 Tax=Teratosphaeria destructans TaxID=418781 RepID=A0A9W7W2I0_9PEZI|nr:hypothetical protein Tdes44962_MAKER09668 [Teratosphaeria destructans]